MTKKAKFNFDNCVTEKTFEVEMFDYIDELSEDLRNQLIKSKRIFK
ncbi:MAG: hypothetical protein LBQ24_03820 [Candidatus Peribacteria bacterium]|jgi:hypothetical protein|nr:hypothetical protein [Candidatus Peribacteria bacterium]